MATGVRDKYHIALNGKGYMLRGAPAKAAYSRSILPSQVNRLAVSDLAYSDFAGQGLFYLAQTDWSAGYKNEKTWRDDAKFYYSTNIDAYSQQGAIKLELELVENTDLGDTEEIYSSCVGSVAGNIREFIGTDDNSSGYPQIYRSDNPWTAIAATEFGTGQNIISQLLCSKEKLWAFTVGVGNTHICESWNYSSWTDHSSAMLTASTLDNAQGARCGCEYANVLYAFIYDYPNDQISIVSTADNGATWAEELYMATDALPVAICGFNGKLYYLLDNYPEYELRALDPVTGTDTEIRKWYGKAMPSWGGYNLLRVFQNKLIVTVPSDKIYSIDTNDNMLEIWSRDSYKFNVISQYLAEGYIYYGCMEYDNRLYWANLIYDGEAFYNHKRPYGDSTSAYCYPTHVNEYGYIRYINPSDRTKLFNNASTYKATLANNYAISNEMAPVQGIDKILDSVVILYEKLNSGETIQVYYSINERSTWVNLGSRVYSGSNSATKYEFKIPGNVIFNKIWFKVHLEGSATTPVLTDLIMAYRPMPEYKSGWSMRLNFSDQVRLLNGQDEQREGYELLSELWKEKMIKQKVILEDVDYAESYLTTSMTATQTSAAIANGSRLPRQGRIRAVSGSVAEEMYYTSAAQKSIKGITRGAHGTVARAYTSGQVLDNGYHVYIEDIKSEINFTDEKKTESIAQVVLIEA